MPFTLRSTNLQPATHLWSGLILFALAIGTLLLIEQTILRVLAGSVLYFLLPGYFLNLALLPEQGWLERITLAIGVSTALSTISVLALELVIPGLLTFVQIWSGLGALSLCTFAIALYAAWQHAGTPSSDPPDPTNRAQNRWWWLAFLLILLLAAALRLAYLNHAELQDDEIDIANVAVRILSGEAEVVFRDRRGPAQTVITAAAYLIGGRPSEWILRLPAVITALATIVGLVALSSRLFNRWLGLVSGLLFSLEGFVFAYGRIVQMQSTLIFMMVATVLCFYNLYRSHRPRDARIYQALGTLFFAFGLLAHYEMALLAPLLLFVYFAKYGRSFWQQDKGGLLVALSILLLTAGAFYLAFILNPAFAETLTYYRDDIVGRAINNSSVQFFLVGSFYNSIYLFGVLYLGAAIAIGVQVRLFLVKHKVANVVLILLFILVAIGALLTLSSAILRSGTQFNGLLLSVALVIAAFCILSPRLPFSTRLLFLWFALYFISYLFLLREVHIHYYAFSPPLAILAAWGWSELYRRGAQRGEISAAAGKKIYLAAWVGATVLLVILSAYYLLLVFVQPMPEYALSFPHNKHPLYPTPYTERYGEAFGFPHRSGWRTIAWLYRNGLLRGSFETNELWLKAQWYTQWREAGAQPRYYLVADLPHRLQASPWPTPFTADDYHLWGVVSVRQQPRLHIYERNTFAPPAQISYWDDEEMAAQVDTAQSIEELARAEHYQADREFFAQAAQNLADNSDAALLFYAPEQSAYFSLFDQSARPYYLPALSVGNDAEAQAQLLGQIADKERNFYALYWGVDDIPWPSNLQSWLNQQLFPVSEAWIGNLRLVAYDVPSVPLAETGIQRQRAIKVGTSIQLVGYTIQPSDELDSNLHLSLFWRALEPVPTRYKVFVHLLDASNTLVSQQDGEPVGGQRPTDTWLVSATDLIQDNRSIPLPPDLGELHTYKLAFGLYDPITSVRLPMEAEDGTQLPNDMLIIDIE